MTKVINNLKCTRICFSLFTLVLFIIFLNSCVTEFTTNLEISPTSPGNTSLAVASTPTKKSTLTFPTATNLPEPTPTATLSPTQTATMLPTPTMVTAPISPANQVINASNISKLTKLGVIGRGIITKFIYSPDGTRLILASETGVWIYRADDHSLIKYLSSDEVVTSIAITGDSKTLFSVGRSGLVNLWNMETFENTDSFDCGETSLLTLVVSNDGRYLATGGDYSSGKVTIWDLTSKKMIKTYKAHTHEVAALVFSPDGNLLASAGSWRDNTIRVWNMQSNLERFSATGHNVYVSELAFSPDGSLLASRGDGRFIKLFKATTGNNIRDLFASSSQGDIVDFTFSNSGQSILAITEQDLLLTLDVKSGKVTSSVPINCGGYCEFRLSPSDDNEISLLKDDKLITMNILEPESYRVLEDHEYIGVTVPYQTTNETLLTISQEKIQEWDLTNGNLISAKEFDFSEFTLFPDRQKIARVEEKNLIRVYELEGMTLVRELPLHDFKEVKILAISPDGSQLVVQTVPGTTSPLVIDSSTGEILFTITGHTENVQGILFSEDEQYMLSIGQSLILWERSSGRSIGNLVGSVGYNTSVSFTPLTNSVISYVNGDIMLWNVPSRSIKTRLIIQDGLDILTISPDERLLVGITYDRKLIAWDLSTGRSISIPDLDISGVWTGNLDFSTDGRLLILSSSGCIRLLGVP